MHPVSRWATAGCNDPALSKAEKADIAFQDGSLALTGAFDGSKRFGMWVDTIAFARTIPGLHFTYFINTCYYDHTVTGSAIGTSHSRDEDIVRMALTQQAINEGHE